VFSSYLEVPGTKKFASKQNLEECTYVHVNKETGFSEKGLPRADQSGESSCVKHNLSASNKRMHLTCVNAEVKVGEKNFCKSEVILLSVNLLCAFVQTKKK
jgi:hypothetical protein